MLGRGRWRVDQKIGQGGFATVWRAFDGKTQRDVAIKVLHGQFAEDRTRRDRFFRGSWKMSELKHPGIVEVVEPYGEENGYYYFVMEYLRDGTLHDAVLGKKVGSAQALKSVAQIGRALEYAHEHGLIHRDVKPSNVLVAGDSDVFAPGARVGAQLHRQIPASELLRLPYGTHTSLFDIRGWNPFAPPRMLCC